MENNVNLGVGTDNNKEKGGSVYAL